jgi:hypothetical protein
VQYIRVASKYNGYAESSFWESRRYTASISFVETGTTWMCEDGETALKALEKLQRSVVVATEPKDPATPERKADAAREVMEMLQRAVTATPESGNTMGS